MSRSYQPTKEAEVGKILIAMIICPHVEVVGSMFNTALVITNHYIMRLQLHIFHVAYCSIIPHLHPLSCIMFEIIYL